MGLLSLSVIAQRSSITEKYIDKFKDIAIREMIKRKIPASITLAQGVLESGSGLSDIAIELNNHFGIKCAGWTGKKGFYKDDSPKDCFRGYENADSSFIDHSFILVTREYYKCLFKLDIKDYKGWANGLKKAGYATNPLYAKKLIKIIEDYNLYLYDQPEIQLIIDSLNYVFVSNVLQ